MLLEAPVRQRTSQVGINQLLSTNRAKSHGTTQKGEITTFTAGITKKGEVGSFLLSRGMIQQSHWEERSGRTQTNFLAITQQNRSFPLVSQNLPVPSGGKHRQLLGRELPGSLWVWRQDTHWHQPKCAAKEQQAPTLCQMAASNAYGMMKHQKKPSVRCTETGSHIRGHLSMFARSCCFPN